MADEKSAIAILQDDFKEVKTSVEKVNDTMIQIGKDVAVLCSNVDRHEKDLQKIREREITTAIAAQKNRRSDPPSRSNGTASGVLTLLFRLLPLILAIGVAVGVFVATGGDDEKTMRALGQVYDMTVKMERRLETVETTAEQATSPTWEPSCHLDTSGRETPSESIFDSVAASP